MGFMLLPRSPRDLLCLRLTIGYYKSRGMCCVSVMCRFSSRPTFCLSEELTLLLYYMTALQH